MKRISWLLLVLSLIGSGFLAAAVPAAANPNPIDWRVNDMYSFSFGIPIPLRYGQHDHEDEDGFGKYHIEDGHGIVPPHEDIQETINLPAPACVTKNDLRHVCVNEDLALVVVFSENIDGRSGDGIAFGIITAYYYIPCFATRKCPPPVPGVTPSVLSYIGPPATTNGQPATLHARLTDNLGIVLPNQPVHFALGTGGRKQQCTGTTDADGTTLCTVTVNQPPAASVPLTITFPGNADLSASSVTTTLRLSTPTTLIYTGPRTLANGEPVTLSAVLKDFAGAALAGRPLALVVGSGATRQTCSATTDQSGNGQCTVSNARQPLNDAATVPFGTFGGDDTYLSSSTTATLRLRYLIGRADGLSANIHLPLLPIGVPPQPDTGTVRTADATTTAPPCSATLQAVVIDARVLCASFVTTLAPANGTATASLKGVTVGLPGLPVIGLSGLTATVAARCGSATGSARVTLTVAGTPVTVPSAPNSVVGIPGGARLIVNEQHPVDGADDGLSVTAAHLVLAGGLGEITLGNATSAVYNCA